MKDKITCHDSKDSKFEVAPDKLTFRPSVYGILIENGKILLSRQWDGYDFPGGGIDIDETIEEACKREFFEETGLKVEILQPIHCETSFFHPSHSIKHKDAYWNSLMIYFLVKKVGGKISTENFDEDEKRYANEAEWVELSRINEIKYFNSVDSVNIINESVLLIKAS